MDEFHPIVCTKTLEIIEVRPVADIFYRYMHSRYLDSWHTNARLTAKQLDQRKRIFAAGEADKNMIAIVEQTILFGGFVKALGETLLKFNERYLLGDTSNHFDCKGRTVLANKKIIYRKTRKNTIEICISQKKAVILYAKYVRKRASVACEPYKKL